MAKGSKIVLEIDAQTAAAIQNIQKFQRSATKSFQKTSQAAQQLKGLVIGLGTAIASRAVVGAFYEAGKAASDFALNIAEIETIIPAGQKSTQELREELFKLQKQFGGKAEAQAKAFYQTISAGVTDAADAAELLEVANKLAIGGIGELAPTVDVLTSIVNTYGLENLSAAEASDLLFTTVKNGKTTLSELSQFIGKALPNSNRLGVSFSELTASIATLTTRGIDTAKASTQLTRFFGAVANGQDRAANLGPKVAAAFDIQTIKTKGLVKWLKDLKVAINGDEAALQKLLGSNEAASAFTILTADNFSKLTASLEDNQKAAGATEEAYQKIFETLSAQGKRLFGIGEQIVIETGAEVTRDLSVEFKALADIISSQSKAISNSLARVGKAFLDVLKITAIFTLEFIDNLNYIFSTLDRFSNKFEEFWAEFDVLETVANPDASGIGNVYNALTDDVKKLAQSTKELDSIQNENIRNLASRYRKDFQAYQIFLKRKEILAKESADRDFENTFDRDRFSRAITDIQKVLEGNRLEIKTKVESPKEEVEKAVKKAAEIAKNVPLEFGFDVDTDVDFSGIKDNIVDQMQDLVDSAEKLDVNKDNTLLERLFNISEFSRIKTEAERLIDLVKTAKDFKTGKPLFDPNQIKTFTDQLKKGSQDAADAYAKTIQDVFKLAGTALSAISAGAKETVDPQKAFEESLKKTNANIADLTKEYKNTQDVDERNKIAEEISKLRNEQKIEAVKAKNDAIKANEKVAKESAGKLVSGVGAGIADAIVPGLGQVVGPLLDIAQQDPEQLKIFLKGLTDAIPVIIEAIANNIDIIVLALAEGLIRALAVLSVKLVDWLWNGLKAGLDAFFGVFLQNIVSGAREFFVGLVSYLSEFFKGIFAPILNIGDSILNAILDGAQALYDSIADALSIDFGLGGGGGFGLGGDKGLLGGSIIPGLLNKGGLVRANTGTLVSGVGNRDKVPALLSPGELVLPANATNNFENVVKEIAQKSGGTNESGGEKIFNIQLQIGDEVLAEQLLRLSNDNLRVA